MLAKSQSSMSKVSVIIPCYNGEKIIGNAIKSVLNQTYKNWELIIVDDGSTDSSCEIVEHYLNNDKIKLVKNAYNKGIAKTMNKGIEVSKGDFIAFLDQDDIWHPTKLELQLQKFENADNSLGLVGCGMVFIENNKCRGIFRINDKKLDQTQILTKMYTGTNSSSIMMLKKDCLKKIGLFDEKLIGWGDFEMVFRVAKFYKIGYVNRLLVKKRVHSESANVKMKKKLRNEAKKIFPLICGYHPFLKSYLPLKEGEIILGEVMESLHDKQYRQARQLSLKAIQYDPRLRIKFKLAYILSCLGDICLVIIYIRNKCEYIYKYIQCLVTFRKERW